MSEKHEDVVATALWAVWWGRALGNSTCWLHGAFSEGGSQSRGYNAQGFTRAVLER